MKTWKHLNIENRKTISNRVVSHIKQIDRYHFFDIDGIQEYHNDRVYIIDKNLIEIIKRLEKTGYQKEEFEGYYIFI